MARDGADVIDVGGESTRPGASPVDEKEEMRRVLPVVRELASRLGGGARISVDTTKPAVAEAALEAGATILNDVSASPVAHGGPGRGRLGGHAHAGPALGHDVPDRVTKTSWPRSRTFLVDRAETGGRGGRDRDLGGPRASALPRRRPRT